MSPKPKKRSKSSTKTRDGLLELARREVDPALGEVLSRLGESSSSDGPSGGHVVPDRLLEAMRYAVLSPGKRLRPALVLGGARAIGARVADVLPAACAVEMVHAYSLVHDDLPAIDDDDLRRGKPTCHRAFDEATALLAGDALLTEAMALLADGGTLGRGRRVRPRARLSAVRELSRAAGAGGMVGGQQDDILEAQRPKERRRGPPILDPIAAEREVERLISVHRRKTGRLIQASTALGAIYGGASVREVRVLREFGAELGLAFQLVDDAIDRDGIAAIAGGDEARSRAAALTEKAIAKLDRFGPRARPLAELARMILERRT